MISVLDNHSRAILSTAVTRTQDLASFLSVLYAAVERYGSPEALVTDGGGVFRTRQARAVYGTLGIAKQEIDRGRPWQSHIETASNVQRRMADWHFSRAESWPELVEAHERFVDDYNHQPHWAHRERPDGRRAPLEVLGFAAGVRHREEELRRAFFSSRYVRVLEALGYARRRLGASTGYRVQQAAENARRRQLVEAVEAGEFRERLSIVDAKKANTTHIDLTPRQQVYRTED